MRSRQRTTGYVPRWVQRYYHRQVDNIALSFLKAVAGMLLIIGLGALVGCLKNSMPTWVAIGTIAAMVWGLLYGGYISVAEKKHLAAKAWVADACQEMFGLPPELGFQELRTAKSAVFAVAAIAHIIHNSPGVAPLYIKRWYSRTCEIVTLLTGTRECPAPISQMMQNIPLKTLDREPLAPIALVMFAQALAQAKEAARRTEVPSPTGTHTN